MQTHTHSVIEATVNTATGFIISWAVWVFIVAPLYDIPYHHGQGLSITGIFTVTSIIRSYMLRRVFNCWHKEHA